MVKQMCDGRGRVDSWAVGYKIDVDIFSLASRARTNIEIDEIGREIFNIGGIGWEKELARKKSVGDQRGKAYAPECSGCRALFSCACYPLWWLVHTCWIFFFFSRCALPPFSLLTMVFAICFEIAWCFLLLHSPLVFYSALGRARATNHALHSFYLCVLIHHKLQTCAPKCKWFFSCLFFLLASCIVSFTGKTHHRVRKKSNTHNTASDDDKHCACKRWYFNRLYQVIFVYIMCVFLFLPTACVCMW